MFNGDLASWALSSSK